MDELEAMLSRAHLRPSDVGNSQTRGTRLKACRSYCRKKTRDESSLRTVRKLNVRRAAIPQRTR